MCIGLFVNGTYCLSVDELAKVIPPDDIVFADGVEESLGREALLSRDRPCCFCVVDLERTFPARTWRCRPYGGRDLLLMRRKGRGSGGGR